MTALVIFRCGSLTCAIEHHRASQVAPLPSLSRPPTMPALLAGFADVGGRATPILDARRLFGLAPTSERYSIHSHILLLKVADGDVGLLVDRVLDVRDVDLDRLLEAPDSATLNDCVRGDLVLDGGAVHLLDTDRLLLASEQLRLAELQKSEQDRLETWRVA